MAAFNDRMRPLTIAGFPLQTAIAIPLTLLGVFGTLITEGFMRFCSVGLAIGSVAVGLFYFAFRQIRMFFPVIWESWLERQARRTVETWTDQ